MEIIKVIEGKLQNSNGDGVFDETFEVTHDAAYQIAKLAFDKIIVNNNNDISISPLDLSQYYFKLEVLGGGCSGFQYKYYMTSDSLNNEEYIEIYSNIEYKIKPLNKELESKIIHCIIKVVTDKISMQYLHGSKLEYVKELGASYFQITNPNAKSRCGCGNSFSV